jgi:hypothetical protein
MAELETLPLSAFCCQNKRCSDYGKKGLGNLYQHNWVDRKTRRIRNLRCRTCKKEFSERKGTAWYRSRLPIEKGLAVARHLAEGDGIRKTGRLVEVDRNTVMRYNRLLGAQGKALHDEQVKHLRVREAQGDEMWAFVGKKRSAMRSQRKRG